MEIEKILKKLKNKDDFNAIELETATARIFINLEYIYFDKTPRRYNLIVDYLSGWRTTKLDLTHNEIIKELNNFKIIKFYQ